MTDEENEKNANLVSDEERAEIEEWRARFRSNIQGFLAEIYKSLLAITNDQELVPDKMLTSAMLEIQSNLQMYSSLWMIGLLARGCPTSIVQAEMEQAAQDAIEVSKMVQNKCSDPSCKCKKIEPVCNCEHPDPSKFN